MRKPQPRLLLVEGREDQRVIPQFMNQTGDPTGTGSGGVGYTVQGAVPATANPQYPLGSLAMAKTSAAPAGTTSNQFFIVAGPEGESLPPDYALFGQVTLDKGRPQQTNFDTYRVLRQNEAPQVETWIVPSAHPPSGVGEPGTPVIMASLPNALFAATGKPVSSFPLVKA